MDSLESVNFRCSAIVFRNSSVLLLRRERDGLADWVLPGGTPRRGESVASCARREVAEETGLRVTVDRVAFVLEASNPAEEVHRLDVVFTAHEQDRRDMPQELESGLTPVFYPLEQLAGLDLRPPIAGHLRNLHSSRGRAGGAYLGNVWRPRGAGEPASPMNWDGTGDDPSPSRALRRHTGLDRSGMEPRLCLGPGGPCSGPWSLSALFAFPAYLLQADRTAHRAKGRPPRATWCCERSPC